MVFFFLLFPGWRGWKLQRCRNNIMISNSCSAGENSPGNFTTFPGISRAWDSCGYSRATADLTQTRPHTAMLSGLVAQRRRATLAKLRRDSCLLPAAGRGGGGVEESGVETPALGPPGADGAFLRVHVEPDTRPSDTSARHKAPIHSSCASIASPPAPESTATPRLLFHRRAAKPHRCASGGTSWRKLTNP